MEPQQMLLTAPQSAFVNSLSKAGFAAISWAATAIFSMALPAVAQPAMLTTQNPSSSVNIRSSPSTDAAIPHRGRAGDRVEIVDEANGKDGYTWYYIRDESGVDGWIRGDFVQVLSTSTETATPPTAQTDTLHLAEPSVGGYTSEQISYLLETALGNEYGDVDNKIKKWSGDVNIEVNGSPTEADLLTLKTVISEINSLAQGIHLQLDHQNPNVEIYFVSESNFGQYEPNYQPDNYGFFWAVWNGKDTISSARILVSTVGITQKERSHLIREELTQSLGLMRDSEKYRDSIFYQEWTDVTEYSELDKTIIAMLYRPEIHPGMTRSQVITALKQINSTTGFLALWVKELHPELMTKTAAWVLLLVLLAGLSHHRVTLMDRK